MDCDEPHPAPNEKTQGIQWTERPSGALVAAGSLWPIFITLFFSGAQRCCALYQPWQLAQLCLAKTIFLRQTVVRNYFKNQEEGKQKHLLKVCF
jgi:hypothetical protein